MFGPHLHHFVPQKMYVFLHIIVKDGKQESKHLCSQFSNGLK